MTKRCYNPLCKAEVQQATPACPTCAFPFSPAGRVLGAFIRLRLILESPFIWFSSLGFVPRKCILVGSALFWVYAVCQLPFMTRGLSQFNTIHAKIIWTLFNPLFWLTLTACGFITSRLMGLCTHGLFIWFWRLPSDLRWSIPVAFQALEMILFTRNHIWGLMWGLGIALYLLLHLYFLVHVPARIFYNHAMNCMALFRLKPSGEAIDAFLKSLEKHR